MAVAQTHPRHGHPVRRTPRKPARRQHHLHRNPGAHPGPDGRVRHRRLCPCGQSGWLDKIQDSVVEQMPGDMGSQVSDLIDSAISSRATVGVVGLLGAAFTGIGWMSGVRMALTEMWAAASNATRCWPSSATC